MQYMLNQELNLSLIWEEVTLPTLESKEKHEKQSTCYQPLLSVFKYKTSLMNNLVMGLTMVSTETQHQVQHIIHWNKRFLEEN